MIYHITTMDEWRAARVSGVYKTRSLSSEGFIHCSKLEQVVDTGNIFFKEQSELVLLCIDETKLNSDVRFESSTGRGKHAASASKLFPHVYGPLNIEAVEKVFDFEIDESGSFVLPNLL